jgi:hypothetical protein
LTHGALRTDQFRRRYCAVQARGSVGAMVSKAFKLPAYRDGAITHYCRTRSCADLIRYGTEADAAEAQR